MVKELVKKALGKKQEAPDVPDELPPLVSDSQGAEDSAAPAAQPAAPTGAQPAPSAPSEPTNKPDNTAPGTNVVEAKMEEEPPGELPSIGQPTAQQSSEGQAAAQPVAQQEAPAPTQPGQQTAQQQTQPNPQPAPQPVSQPTPQQEVQEHSVETLQQAASGLSDEPETMTGFFARVGKVLNTHEALTGRILDEDLFGKMQDFWKRNHEGSTYEPSDQKLKEQVKSELRNLESLEAKWRMQKNLIEEDKKFLKQREGEIKDSIQNLKRLLHTLKILESVPDDKAFHFAHKARVHNLKELIDVLKVTDDADFIHHIHKGTNDFSKWIDHAIGDGKLAGLVKDAQTREDLITLLEQYIALDIQKDLYSKKVEPHNYFVLRNGKTIKSIDDLYNELKKESGSLFKYHVNGERNDFSTWVEHVFNDRFLADQISQAKSKEDLLKLLEVIV